MLSSEFLCDFTFDDNLPKTRFIPKPLAIPEFNLLCEGHFFPAVRFLHNVLRTLGANVSRNISKLQLFHIDPTKMAGEQVGQFSDQK